MLLFFPEMGNSINVCRYCHQSICIKVETAWWGIICSVHPCVFIPFFPSIEPGNARPHGVLPGRPGSSTPVQQQQARDRLQVSSPPPTPPPQHHSWVLAELIEIFSSSSSSLSSKPLTPTTQGSKALPFIKVIEIKSWGAAEHPARSHLVYIHSYLSTQSCVNYWLKKKGSWWQSTLIFVSSCRVGPCFWFLLQKLNQAS